MKLTEEQIEKIRHQSLKVRDVMNNLDKEFTALAESFGLEEDTGCARTDSALDWLHDAVYNFPPVNLYGVEGFEKCIEVIGQRLEEIKNEKSQKRHKLN